MTHAHHAALEGYDSRQILHDGCQECHDRGRDVRLALAHMDIPTFARAWKRAYDWKATGGGGWERTGDISHNEYDLLSVLWAIQVMLENFGIPVNGQVPTGPRLPSGDFPWGTPAIATLQQPPKET